MNEYSDIYLTANDIYDLITERWNKRNGLKSPASVWHILPRFDLDKIKKKGKTYYKLKKDDY